VGHRVGRWPASALGPARSPATPAIRSVGLGRRAVRLSGARAAEECTVAAVDAIHARILEANETVAAARPALKPIHARVVAIHLARPDACRSTGSRDRERRSTTPDSGRKRGKVHDYLLSAARNWRARR